MPSYGYPMFELSQDDNSKNTMDTEHENDCNQRKMGTFWESTTLKTTCKWIKHRFKCKMGQKIFLKIPKIYVHIDK